MAPLLRGDPHPGGGAGRESDLPHRSHRRPRGRHLAPDAESQIRRTFENITDTLTEAGATWADVVEIHSYHVGYRAHADVVLQVAAEFLDDPYPAWTAVGVTELFEPEALVEVSCVAVVA